MSTPTKSPSSPLNTSTASDEFVDAEEFSSPATKLASSPAVQPTNTSPIPIELAASPTQIRMEETESTTPLSKSPSQASPSPSLPPSLSPSNENSNVPPIDPNDLPQTSSPPLPTHKTAPPSAPLTSSPPLGVHKSTFSGDRGGDANDAELLALLKGISSGSSGQPAEPGPAPAADGRPKDGEPKPEAAAEPSTAAKTQELPTPDPAPTPNPTPTPAAADPSAADAAPAATATAPVTDNPTSKNWKERKQVRMLPLLTPPSETLLNPLTPLSRLHSPQSYEHLTASLPSSPPSLDSSLASYLSDSNAAALDAALDLAIAYCSSSPSIRSAPPALLTSITEALAKTPFNSSRPTTSAKSRDLPTALIANCNDSANFKTVVSSLLTSGVEAKKPKIVMNCFEAVVDACVNFGARHMPLPMFLSVAPKIVTHADGRIRDHGISILAEICRAFKSKDIASDIISSLKPSQANQLDAMLESKPNSSSPKCPPPCCSAAASNTVKCLSRLSPRDNIAATLPQR